MILEVELVPKTAWRNNLRKILTKKEWDKVRTFVKFLNKNKCYYCKLNKTPLEAHEVWHYDDHTKIQKLDKIIAVCNSCHGAIHYGFSESQGRGQEAIQTLIKINNINHTECLNYLNKCFKVWAERSRYEWKIDITKLSDYLK